MSALRTAVKPSLIIIPGNFSLPRFWSTIQKSVQDRGYPVEVVGLKSSREEPIDPAPGLADDVKEASLVLNRHIDQGKDVVLLMHSYGGMVGTEATRGLSRIEREKDGSKGGIIRMVFLASIFAPPGRSTRGLYDANPGRYPRKEVSQHCRKIWIKADCTTPGRLSGVRRRYSNVLLQRPHQGTRSTAGSSRIQAPSGRPSIRR